MKLILTTITTATALALSSACSVTTKGDALHEAVNQGQFKGLNKNTRFSYSVPNDHSGPYSTIEQFNISIDDGPHKGKNASAFLGKSRKTNQWDVFQIMVEENGHWTKLPEVKTNAKNNAKTNAARHQ